MALVLLDNVQRRKSGFYKAQLAILHQRKGKLRVVVLGKAMHKGGDGYRTVMGT